MGTLNGALSLPSLGRGDASLSYELWSVRRLDKARQQAVGQREGRLAKTLHTVAKVAIACTQGGVRDDVGREPGARSWMAENPGHWH